MARQGGLQATGSYRTGGRSSLSLRGVYSAEIGTTVLVASIRDDGQTFHDNRTPVQDVVDEFRTKFDDENAFLPSRSSTSSKFNIMVRGSPEN